MFPNPIHHQPHIPPQPQNQQYPVCPKHPHEPIKGICFFNGKCDDRLMCRTCRRGHDSGHLNYYEELEDLMRKDNLTNDIKVSLESMLNVINNQNSTYDNNSNYIVSQINYLYKEIETNILQKLLQTRDMLIDQTRKKLEKNSDLKKDLMTSIDDMMRAYDRAIGSKFNPPSTAEEMVQAICRAQLLRDRIESDPELQAKETINWSITRLATTVSGSLFQQVKLSLDQIYQDISHSFSLDVATKLPSVSPGRLIPGRKSQPKEETGFAGLSEDKVTPQKILELFKQVDKEEAAKKKVSLNAKGGPKKKKKQLLEYEGEADLEQRIISGGLVYVPEKQELVTGGNDGKIQIVSMKDMKTRLTFNAHSSQDIMRLLYIPQKELLLSAGVDGKINVWGYKHRCEPRGSFTKHNGAVNAMEYLPDVDLIVSGGEDEYIRFWSVNTCNEQFNLKRKDVKIGSICRMGNTKKMAVGFDKGHVEVIVIGQMKKTAYTIPAHTAYVFNLAYLEMKKWLVTGSEDGSIKIWRVMETQAEFERKFIQDRAMVRSFVMFPEQDLIVGNYHDNYIRLWKMSNEQILEEHNDQTCGEALVAMYDRDEIATANASKKVKKWVIDFSKLK